MILVTGGAGFIGANFVLDWLRSCDEPVVNLDALTYAGNLENLASLQGDARHIFVHGDICDRELIDRLLAEPALRRPLAGRRVALLAHPEDWLDLGRPVLMALSMKSLFGGLLGLPPQERGLATATATAMLRARGVFWHRVHDVVAARQAMTLALALEAN